MTCKHCTDQEMIDYILGKLGADQAAAIEKQVKECEGCQEQFNEWVPLLQVNEVAQPSKKLKNRVMKSFIKEQYKKSVRPVPLFAWKSAGVAVAVCLLFLTIWIHNFSNQATDVPAQDSLFVMKDDTDLYEFAPNINHNLKGYAWINSRTQEMYIFVDGLLPIEDKDYQAWVKSETKLHDAGIIQLIGSRGQLYLNSEPIEKAQYIILSIEPKGGSPFPTEQDSYLIHLNAR